MCVARLWRLWGWAFLLASLSPQLTLGDSYDAQTGRIRRAVGRNDGHDSPIPVRHATGTARPRVLKTADLPKEMIVEGAQPSVFKLIREVSLTVTYPNEIHFKKPSDVADWADTGGTEHCWRRLMAEGPGKYLTYNNRVRETFDNEVLGTGSAFAISEQGVLLTNAHMVADPERNKGLHPEKNDEELDFTAKLLKTPMIEAMKEIARVCRGPRPRGVAVNPLLLWLARESATTGTCTGGHLLLSYGVDLEAALAVSRFEKRKMLDLKEKSILTPFTVALKGELWPGKDVAVIVAPELKGMVIRLKMGDSDNIRPQQKVRALGFPGKAFKGYMHGSAEYRVTSTPGEISDTKPMGDGDWSMIEHSAQIDHGNSGGPLLDDQGRVIGLNVALYDKDFKAGFAAIPINVAKEYVETAWKRNLIPHGPLPPCGHDTIECSNSPLTALWEEGLQAFSAERWKEAESKFEAILGQQGAPKEVPFAPSPSHMIGNFNFINPYVQAKQADALKHLRELSP